MPRKDPRAVSDEVRKQYVGRQGMYSIKTRYPEGSQTGTQEMVFPVKVIAIKQAFGRLYLSITPVGGTGNWWVLGSLVVFSP